MSVTQARKSVLITGYVPLLLYEGGFKAVWNGGIDAPQEGLDMLLQESSIRKLGLHVIATARSRETITDLEAMGMSTVSLEVTNSESIEAAKREVEVLTGGKLDILINNAGRNCTLPALDVPIDDARACFETNFFAVLAITQSFIPLLIASKGLIINIGSIAAIVPYVFGSVYNASKAALHAYSRTLRLELEPYDVRVMVVVTGGVQSNIARIKRQLPEGSLYLEIKGDFERRLNHSQEGAMDHDVYARGVVAEALKARPTKWLWRGNKALLIWFARAWLGTWVFDLVIPKMFGLDRLKALVRGKTKIS